ncbi:MAG: non-homologous end-joining DNA ligase [Vicinamibacterales bacterium]
MISISHPEKVLFPDAGITKGELADYYEQIAPVMLPHVRNRPVTMERFHRGIGKPGFFQKDVSKGFPSWLKRAEVPKKDGVVHHPLVTDARSLVWLANQNSITPHVWGSRVPDLEHPDICVFDLDPSVDDPAALRFAALALRDLLDELGLPAWVKTSGSKGYHIAIPLDRKTHIGAVAGFAHRVGALLVSRHPDRLTQAFHKKDRGRRILVDTGRNGYSASFAAVYAVGPKSGAPISAPCTWKEVESGKAAPRAFTLRTMLARVEAVGDLWADLNVKKNGRSLTRPAARLERLRREKGA